MPDKQPTGIDPQYVGEPTGTGVEREKKAPFEPITQEAVKLYGTGKPRRVIVRGKLVRDED